jgi:hypothetical protein
MNHIDLRHMLQSWPYEAGKNVRLGYGGDGREIILVRLQMGIEQYEVDGRPDGLRVHGMDSALAFHQARLSAAKQTPSGIISWLTAEDYVELLHEASAYLHRLNLHFRLENWARAEQDAAQILRVLDFVKQHAPCAQGCVQLDLWQAYATHRLGVARALLLMERKQYLDAFQTARKILGTRTDIDNNMVCHGRLAEALLETVQDSMASFPIFDPHEKCSFMRQDDYWAIRYHGHNAFLKSSRGLQCLAILLRSPDREFHVCELLAALLETPAAAAVSANACARENGDLAIKVGLNGDGPILDARAKVEYRSRVKELREELEEAERFNDPTRASRSRDELNAIALHLAASVGLGGRDRRTSSESERARCAVTKRIKQAIQRIGDAVPGLGHHLAASIRTGYFCSYNPDPDRSVAWKF